MFSGGLSRKVKESTVDFVAGNSPYDYWLNMGAKIEFAIMQSITLCDSCLWTVSGVLLQKVLTLTVIFYILNIAVHKKHIP